MFWNGFKRHVDYTRGLAENAAEEELRIHYTQVADCNEWLLEEPRPGHFGRHVQVWLFESVTECIMPEARWDRWMSCSALTMKKTLESFGLTDEEAVWYFASLFFNDFHYSQIGGLTPAGIRIWQAVSAS